MAAPVSYWYANAKKAYADGSGTVKIDWVNTTIKAVLTSSSYVPDIDGHSFASSITNIVGSPVTLTTKSLTKVGSGATAKYALKSDKTTFSGNLTARYLILYQDTGVLSTSPLLIYTLLDSAPADLTSAVGIEVTPDATNGWMLVG